MNEKKQRIEALFEEALALTAPESRAGHLDRACVHDADLRREVEELLRAAEQAGGFLALKPGETAATFDEPQPSSQGESALVEQPGTVIGRYKLLEKIGEGGCGVVFMAEQEEPVRRKVALKIIKPGMDSRQVIARFEAERQALAMMDHPNIAKVFDGGVTGEGRAGILPAPAASAANDVKPGAHDNAPPAPGRQDACPTFARPYFVMELVRGIRITDYCEQHNLSTRQRLDLFIAVCTAIQHAHQKGVIHRDIKPSNVLVTENDGQPVPKVIDFGIAKATEQKLTDKTLFTQFAAFIGTPDYMSPEQAALTNLDIDTRSDIYSLGVLLYELLTGTTPFDAQELLKAGFDEMRRVIREKEPERPSTRLTALQGRKGEGEKVSKTGAAPPSPPAAGGEGRGEEGALSVRTAPLPNPLPARSSRGEGEDPRRVEDRRSRTKALNSQLKSLSTDLDWIVMKCLEKDRTRRYETANGLAADIQRHLSNEPVVARPPSAAYRFQKMVRRNKAAFGAAVALVVVASLGVGGILIQLQRVERQWQRADDNAANERRERYYASIAAADSHIRNGDIDVALNVLTNCPPEFRHWEWGRLLYLCHQSISTVQLPLPSNEAGPVIVNADGSRVAFYQSGRGSQAHCRDIQTGRELFTFGNATNAVFTMTFSPDGRRIAMARLNGLVKIWDAETGEERTQFSATNRVQSLQFNGDATRLAVTTIDRRGSLWDSSTGQLLFTTAEVPGPLRTSALDPTGRFWATMNDANVITVRDARTGQPRYTAQGHADVNPMSTFNLPTLLFSPDGQRLLAHALPEVAKVWDVADGREIAIIPIRVHDAAFSPDGQRVAIFSGNKTAEVWDLAGSGKVRTLSGHRAAVNAIAYSPDSQRIVTASADGTVKTWNASFGREIIPHPFYADDVAFSPDGRRLITTQFDGMARVWESASGREVLAFRGNWNWLRAANFSPDGARIVTGGADRLARIFDADSGRELLVLKGHTSAVRAARFSPNGRRIATASWDKTARLWDANSGQELFTLNAHTEPVRSIVFTPDGSRLITGGQDAGAHVWEVETGRHLFKLSEGMAFSVAISQDGRRIATGSFGKSIRLWEARTGQLLAKWSTRDQVQALDFSPDGKRLIVAASDSIGQTAYPTLEIWDVETGRQVLAFQGHANLVLAVKFSPDGRRIASSSFDRVARLWETFPWEENAYPQVTDQSLVTSTATPLLARVSAYAESYWRDRLATERSRRSDEADAASTNASLPEPSRFPRSAWPARDPNASPSLIDLSTQYNALLNVPWRLILNESDYDNDLSNLPTGILTLSNVTFDVRGMVRLNPTDRVHPYEGDRNFFSDAVKGIPVNARFHRFHLFHGAQGSAPEGIIICHYVLRYADGSERQIPITNGRDVRDWRELDSDTKPGSDRGVVAWRGTNPPILEQNGRLRLYLTTFENPRPDVEVKTIDLVSTRTRCAHFLIALTIEP